MYDSSDDENKKIKRSRDESLMEDSESISKDEISISKPKKRTFTIEEKIKIAKEALDNGIHATSRKYVIDRKTIRVWIKNIDELKNTNNKKVKRNLSGAGRKPYITEIENNLIEFIKKYREIEIAISIHELIIEAQILFPPIINNSYNANMMCAYRFLKRNILQ